MFTSVLDRRIGGIIDRAFGGTAGQPSGGMARLGSSLSSPLPVDAFLRLVDPLWSSTTCRARVEHVQRETPDAVTIVLRPGRGWGRHRPGQWVALGVDIDGVRHRRPYSITSVPGAAGGRVSLTVQEVPGGAVSPFLVRRLEVGDIVHLDQPQGSFTLDHGDPQGLTGESPAAVPTLFVTGGSGITPVVGIIRSLTAGTVAEAGTTDRPSTIGVTSAGSPPLDAEPPPLDAVLLHHATSEERSLFTAELRAAALAHPGLRFELVITGSGPVPSELALTPERLDTLCPDWRDREIWTCGPEPLTAALQRAAAGCTRGLHFEEFQAAPRAVGVDVVSGRVRFARSGIEVQSDGTVPLLQLAEDAGLAPRHGCRMGICHTCVVPVTSGATVDLRDGHVRRDPGDFVQICVSAPCGDLEIDL